MGPTDEQLIRSLAGGREDALEALYARHEGRVLGFFARRLQRFEDAEEAAQDVFIRIQRGAPTFNGSAFLPWLGAISRNVLRDRLRQRPRLTTVPLVDDPVAWLEVYEREITTEEVRAALATLPAEYRRAIVLKYLAGLSYREAARELSLSEKGFETRLARARLRLRAALARRRERQDGLRL